MKPYDPLGEEEQENLLNAKEERIEEERIEKILTLHDESREYTLYVNLITKQDGE